MVSKYSHELRLPEKHKKLRHLEKKYSRDDGGTQKIGLKQKCNGTKVLKIDENRSNYCNKGDFHEALVIFKINMQLDFTEVALG